MQRLLVVFTVAALAGAVSVPLPAEPVRAEPPKAEPNRPHSRPRSAARGEPRTTRAEPPRVEPPRVGPAQCGCLNWKATYDQGLVKCGEGRESYTGQEALTRVVNTDGSPAVQSKVCDGFFTRVSFNQCVNMNPGAGQDTWCYVDKSCPALNGGGTLRKVNWKRCADARSGDTFLRDFSPAMLYEMSKRHDVAFSDFVKMAYPGSRVGAEGPVSLSDFSGGIPARVDKQLGRDGLRGKAYWFDTNATGPLPAVLVVGSAVYKVDRRRNAKLIAPEHPGTWEALQCLANCPKPHVAYSGAVTPE